MDYTFNEDINGKDILEEIKTINKDTQVVMLSGQQDIPSAINTLKEGAFDYIIKNDNAFYRLNEILSDIQMEEHLKKHNSLIKDPVDKLFNTVSSFLGLTLFLAAIVGLVYLFTFLCRCIIDPWCFRRLIYPYTSLINEQKNHH